MSTKRRDELSTEWAGTVTTLDFTSWLVEKIEALEGALDNFTAQELSASPMESLLGKPITGPGTFRGNEGPDGHVHFDKIE